VSDRGVSGGVYKRACATEDQGARLMASGCMVDLFGASTMASDYLVKTEPALGRWTSLGEDSSDQSLSHRSDGFSEYPASTGMADCAVDRRLRGLIIIKQRSKRQLHSERSEAGTDHFRSPSADNDKRLVAVAVRHSGRPEPVDEERGDSFVRTLST
jgi:hypothetical protein